MNAREDVVRKIVALFVQAFMCWKYPVNLVRRFTASQLIAFNNDDVPFPTNDSSFIEYLVDIDVLYFFV